MRISPKIVLCSVALTLAAPAAHAFDIDFSWSGLKLCTSGKPNRVNSPEFKLKDVPTGTKFIRFKLVDKDVPSYNHGGGVVAYKGGGSIAAGAFKYKSPCPPNGTHTYEWRATAQSKKNGGKLADARKSRDYP